MPHVATQMVRMTVRVTEASLGMVSIVQVLAAITGFMKKNISTMLCHFFTFFPGVRFSKDPKTLRARKAIRKTPTRLLCKAGLFIC